MATYRYLDDNNSDGTILGQSATGKIGFYGATPIVKPTVTITGTSGTTVASTIAVDVYYLRAALVSLGLITTA